LLVDMRRQAARDAEWLFPSPRGGHRTNINDAWVTLRKAAHIPDVRTHDLRHTYASVLASSGMSLPIIGALLGHSQPATTARYAHLLDDPLREATERAGAILARKTKGGVDVVHAGAPNPQGRVTPFTDVDK
jgi:integrase